MNNQQNGRVILCLTWRKYETMHQLLTCTCLCSNVPLTKQFQIKKLWVDSFLSATSPLFPWKLFFFEFGGNYSREENIQGLKLFDEIQYIKGKSAYRWHFQYHLPSCSCQRSLWTSPYAFLFRLMPWGTQSQKKRSSC